MHVVSLAHRHFFVGWSVTPHAIVHHLPVGPAAGIFVSPLLIVPVVDGSWGRPSTAAAVIGVRVTSRVALLEPVLRAISRRVVVVRRVTPRHGHFLARLVAHWRRSGRGLAERRRIDLRWRHLLILKLGFRRLFHARWRLLGLRFASLVEVRVPSIVRPVGIFVPRGVVPAASIVFAGFVVVSLFLSSLVRPGPAAAAVGPTATSIVATAGRNGA